MFKIARKSSASLKPLDSGPSADIARKSLASLKPLDPGLSAEVLDWVKEVREIWDAMGLSMNQFASLYPIDKGTISRYLNGQRVPRDRWFLDKLLAIRADNGKPVTPEVHEHLTQLHLRALQTAHPHEYRVRLLNEQLELALTAKLEAERYARTLEEKLAQRNRQVQELGDDKGRLRAAWAADREAMEAEYGRLTQEIHDINEQLHLARERAVEAEQRCHQLEHLLDELDPQQEQNADLERDLKYAELERELKYERILARLATMPAQGGSDCL